LQNYQRSIAWHVSRMNGKTVYLRENPEVEERQVVGYIFYQNYATISMI
jgi:hypothetical protein